MGEDDNAPDGGTATPDNDAAAAKAAAEEKDLGKTDAEKVAEAEAADAKTAQEAKDAADKEAADKVAKEDADKAAEAVKANKERYGEVTGIQEVDDVAQILAERDIDADDAKALFGEAYETRDLSKIDQAKLIDLVGEGTARMIMTSLTDGITKQDEAKTAMVADIYTAAGGQEAFDSAVEWMNSLEEGDFFDSIQETRDLINGGGLGAKMATEHLVASFKSSGDFTETADLIVATGGSKDSSGDYLSRNDYANALRGATTEAQVKALDARRLRSMKQEAAQRG